MTFSVDAAEVVRACTGTLKMPTPEGTSPCDMVPVGSQTDYHWLRDGRPVGGTVKRDVREEITIDP